MEDTEHEKKPEWQHYFLQFLKSGAINSSLRMEGMMDAFDVNIQDALYEFAVYVVDCPEEERKNFKEYSNRLAHLIDGINSREKAIEEKRQSLKRKIDAFESCTAMYVRYNEYHHMSRTERISPDKRIKDDDPRYEQLVAFKRLKETAGKPASLPSTMATSTKCKVCEGDFVRFEKHGGSFYVCIFCINNYKEAVIAYYSSKEIEMERQRYKTDFADFMKVVTMTLPGEEEKEKESEDS